MAVKQFYMPIRLILTLTLGVTAALSSAQNGAIHSNIGHKGGNGLQEKMISIKSLRGLQGTKNTSQCQQYKHDQLQVSFLVSLDQKERQGEGEREFEREICTRKTQLQVLLHVAGA